MASVVPVSGSRSRSPPGGRWSAPGHRATYVTVVARARAPTARPVSWGGEASQGGLSLVRGRVCEARYENAAIGGQGQVPHLGVIGTQDQRHVAHAGAAEARV